MKNIFLYILVISLLFFGCKSTDNVATPENIENQDSVQIDEVLPVEDVLENTDLNQNDSTLQNEDNMNLSQSEIDKFIEEKGDFMMNLYQLQKIQVNLIILTSFILVMNLSQKMNYKFQNK